MHLLFAPLITLSIAVFISTRSPAALVALVVLLSTWFIF